jgi:hypothetical protein
MLAISIIINQVLNSADSLLARDGLRFSRTVDTGIARYIFAYLPAAVYCSQIRTGKNLKKPLPGKAQAFRIVQGYFVDFLANFRTGANCPPFASTGESGAQSPTLWER